MNNKRDITGARIGGGYSKIGMRDLILLSIYRVIKKGEVCTFERLVEECFTNFPKVFGFKRYPEWPDSLKLDRPLRKLRADGLVRGNVRTAFNLTTAGEAEAEKVENTIGKGILLKRKILSRGRSVEDRIISELTESAEYRDFLKNRDNFSISEMQIRKLLRLTLDTPLSVVKSSLEYYKKVAGNYHNRDLLNFLFFCSAILTSYNKKVKGTELNS